MSSEAVQKYWQILRGCVKRSDRGQDLAIGVPNHSRERLVAKPFQMQASGTAANGYEVDALKCSDGGLRHSLNQHFDVLLSAKPCQNQMVLEGVAASRKCLLDRFTAR